MSTFFSYFWPAFAAGIACGIVAGVIGLRPAAARNLSFAIGVAASIALAALWHGPLGAADRFSVAVERDARDALVAWEIPQVSAQLHHGPLTRRLILTGPADDFQRSQLVLILVNVSGVESARWSPAGGGPPLIVEGALAAVLGFLFGLLVAYLIEIRRRYNAQWNW